MIYSAWNCVVHSIFQTFKVVNQKNTNKKNKNGKFSNLNGKHFPCCLSDMNPYKSDENRNANFSNEFKFALKITITNTHIHCTDISYGWWWKCDRFYNRSNRQEATKQHAFHCFRQINFLLFSKTPDSLWVWGENKTILCNKTKNTPKHIIT